MKVLIGCGCSLISLALILGCNEAGEKKVQKPDEKKESPTSAAVKYTIKQVMKEGEGKGGLAPKVNAGTATQEEKDKLVEMFVAMSEQTPRKGTPESWRERTTALVDAAKAVAKGDANALDSFKKANNCMSCHEVHKGAGGA